MSRIYFEESYIIVYPSYDQTRPHQHNMLHIFIGESELSLDTEFGIITGRVIFLDGGVLHSKPKGQLSLFLFVDPTSTLAERIREYFPDQKAYATVDSFKSYGCEPNDIRKNLSEFFGDDCFIKRVNLDARILNLLEDIDSFQYLGKRVSDIAASLRYSESYLSHLFKSVSGVSLKSYLLMKQLEYAWTKISLGEEITKTSLDAGFASPSHFADVCLKLTGISAKDVLKQN